MTPYVVCHLAKFGTLHTLTAKILYQQDNYAKMSGMLLMMTGAVVGSTIVISKDFLTVFGLSIARRLVDFARKVNQFSSWEPSLNTT